MENDPEQREKVVKQFCWFLLLLGLGYFSLYAMGAEYIATLVMLTSLICLIMFVMWRCHVIANRPLPSYNVDNPVQSSDQPYQQTSDDCEQQKNVNPKDGE